MTELYRFSVGWRAFPSQQNRTLTTESDAASGTVERRRKQGRRKGVDSSLLQACTNFIYGTFHAMQQCRAGEGATAYKIGKSQPICHIPRPTREYPTHRNPPST